MNNGKKILTSKQARFLRAANIVSSVILVLFTVFVVYLTGRIFLFDTFMVNSSSMEPTIMPGDKIMVNKVLMGPRLYRSLSLNEKEPEIFRIKGFRGILHNDIVVFNHSPAEKWAGNLEFSISTVYVKRCIGLPGDTINIVDGIYLNSKLQDTVGMRKTQLRDQYIQPGDEAYGTFPFHINVAWNMKYFGPYYIPCAGDTIELSPENVVIYKKYIDRECGSESIITDSGLIIDGKAIKNYIFKENYYFMAGDNILDSRDSRYLGLVPESYIVGIVRRVAYSRDPHNGKILFNRIMRRLQ